MTFNEVTGQLEVTDMRISSLESYATEEFTALKESYTQAIAEATGPQSDIVKRLERLEEAVFPLG